jgi:hypothetical protein
MIRGQKHYYHHVNAIRQKDFLEDLLLIPIPNETDKYPYRLLDINFAPSFVSKQHDKLFCVVSFKNPVKIYGLNAYSLNLRIIFVHLIQNFRSQLLSSLLDAHLSLHIGHLFFDSIVLGLGC